MESPCPSSFFDPHLETKVGLRPIPVFHTHLPSGETKCPDFCNFHRPPGPAGLHGRLRLGGRVAPRQARGGQVQVAAQEGGGGGAAGCHRRGGGGASLRSSAGNVGRVPPVRYVWINIVSLRRHADFANCASAGAAGLEGVLGHWEGHSQACHLSAAPRSAALPSGPRAGFFPRLNSCYLWLRSKLHSSPGLGLKVASPEG